ncbi:T9SS type A sorting domain-containing protein [Cyclonatronum proteinivorum]|nr:T9SS type A sorting domain-containing protein [Cyclonatronum proteinivorum]
MKEYIQINSTGTDTTPPATCKRPQLRFFNKVMTLALALIFVWGWGSEVIGQVTFNGNTRTGFGGAVGNSTMEWSESSGTITVTFTKGAGDFSDALVIYLFTGAAGRNVIDGQVNDQEDELRLAISSAGADGSTITFFPGFEASHAIGINAGFGGLWSIPATGSIGNNGLDFVTSVNSTLNSTTQASFTFSFTYANLGLNPGDPIYFVATYLNGTNGFTSNEGYGSGLPGNNPGPGAVTFTSFLEYPTGVERGTRATAQAGNWDSNATWANNVTPLALENVVIGHDVTLNVNAEVRSLTINSGQAFVFENEESRQLTIRSGGALTNNGAFTANDGKVIFAGTGTVTGPLTFNDVDIAGGVNFGSGASRATLGGILSINPGGFVQTNPPIYAAGSTLRYNTVGTYGRGSEWPSVTLNPSNNPHHVVVNSILSMGDHTTGRAVNGNLTILEERSLALSSAVGGDLRVRGNWVNEGIFTANNRAVFFDGTQPQTIENEQTGGISIPFLFIQNNVRALSDLTVATRLSLQNSTLTIGSGNALVAPTQVTEDDNGINYVDTGAALAFERDIVTHSRWIGISMPVAGVNFAGSGGVFDPFWTQGDFTGSDDPNANDENANLRLYNEVAGDYKVPGTADFQPGVGYLFYVFERKDRDDPETALTFPFTLTVSGQENTFSSGIFPFPVTFNSEGGNGWNLLANPFGAALDWDNLTRSDATDFNGFAYVLEPSSQRYLATGGAIEGTVIGNDLAPHIAPFQAFWVKAENNDANLSATPANRTINTDNADLFNTTPIPVFSLRLTADNLQSTTAFRFGEGFSTSFANTDAYFLSGLTTTFAFTYSLKDETPTMINSLPIDLTEAISFPIAAGAYVEGNAFTGEASFTWPAFENIPADWSITLTDTYTGTVIDLRDATSYSFIMEAPMGLMAKVETFKDFQHEGTPVMNPMFAGERFILTIDPEVPTSAPISGELPREVSLSQNYPNPFNPTTLIRFELPASEEVRLEVFNVQGQRVATLVNGTVQAGVHNVSFDASSLSSGVYLYRLQAGNQVLTRKMTLIK